MASKPPTATEAKASAEQVKLALERTYRREESVEDNKAHFDYYLRTLRTV